MRSQWHCGSIGSGGGGSGGGTCSFDGDTLVLTEDGYEPIRDLIAYEDRVWSRDEGTGDAGWQSVLQRYSNIYHETVYITIRDIESGSEQIITSNRIHPFFVQLPQSRSLLHLTSVGMDVLALERGPLFLPGRLQSQ